MVPPRRLNPSSAHGPGTPGGLATLRAVPGVFQYTRHALELVWSTSRALTVALALLTLAAGVLPAGIAWIGAQIVDAVVAAMATHRAGGGAGFDDVLVLVALEGLLVAALAAVQRGRERLMYPFGLRGRVRLAARPDGRFEHHEPLTAKADLVQKSSHVVDPLLDAPAAFQIAAISIAAREDEH